jgi:hypothetical protein
LVLTFWLIVETITNIARELHGTEIRPRSEARAIPANQKICTTAAGAKAI